MAMNDATAAWDLHVLAAGLFRGSFLLLDSFDTDVLAMGEWVVELAGPGLAVTEYFGTLGIDEDDLYTVMEQARGRDESPLGAVKGYVLQKQDEAARFVGEAHPYRDGKSRIIDATCWPPKETVIQEGQ